MPKRSLNKTVRPKALDMEEPLRLLRGGVTSVYTLAADAEKSEVKSEDLEFLARSILRIHDDLRQIFDAAVLERRASADTSAADETRVAARASSSSADGEDEFRGALWTLGSDLEYLGSDLKEGLDDLENWRARQQDRFGDEPFRGLKLIERGLFSIGEDIEEQVNKFLDLDKERAAG